MLSRANGKDFLPVMCELCGVKEISVFIKACGHDIFCFGCIQGLQECPVCGGVITSWGCINPRSKPDLALILAWVDSEYGDHGAVLVDIVPLEEKSECPVEDAKKAGAFADDSSDGSDSDNGLV